MYFNNGKLDFIVFSVIQRSSFEHLSYWIKKIKVYDSNPSIIIIGQRSNNEADRKVTLIEAHKFCEANKINYVEFSYRNDTIKNDILDIALKQITGDKSYKIIHNPNETTLYEASTRL